MKLYMFRSVRLSIIRS